MGNDLVSTMTFIEEITKENFKYISGVEMAEEDDYEELDFLGYGMDKDDVLSNFLP
ncbi:hypothetical protein [Mesobacillus harenae]|uniref:hypothetical protein n=1 Tax=Mesobacillus harenae TaxID=2213203 RepID=UPI00158091C5|nr:hypothetical protein [Mesobacillus harenae]